MKKEKGTRKTLGDSKKTEVELLREQLARALADYDNFRKRTEREREELKAFLTGKLVVRFLPVLDQLYEAQKHLKDGGLALTINSFEETLKSEGIERIEPKEGEDFNEELHEAIEVGKNEKLGDGQVIECVLRGWRFSGGNVIRHAKVKVNKKEEK